MTIPLTTTLKRVFITGASGFVGQHIVQVGLHKGTELHLLSRSGNAVEGCHVWRGDLTEAEGIHRILGEIRPDGVIHLAASGVAYGTISGADVIQVNAVSVATLFDALIAHRLSPTVVLAGSGFEYQTQDRDLSEDDPAQPSSLYGISKLTATLLAEFYSKQMPVCVLRLFSLYGLGEKEPRLAPYIIAQAKRGAPIELTAGEQLRDYAYVGDVAEACWKALENTATRAASTSKFFQILNVASGHSITLRGFIDLLADQLRQHGVQPDLRFGARPYRLDEIMNYTANIRRMQSAWGWSLPTSLEDGLAIMVKSVVEE